MADDSRLRTKIETTARLYLPTWQFRIWLARNTTVARVASYGIQKEILFHQTLIHENSFASLKPDYANVSSKCPADNFYADDTHIKVHDKKNYEPNIDIGSPRTGQARLGEYIGLAALHRGFYSQAEVEFYQWNSRASFYANCQALERFTGRRIHLPPLFTTCLPSDMYRKTGY